MSEQARQVDGEQDGRYGRTLGDASIHVMVCSLPAVWDQPDLSLAHEAFRPPDEVVLHFQLHHAVNQVAAADIVDGRFRAVLP